MVIILRRRGRRVWWSQDRGWGRSGEDALGNRDLDGPLRVDSLLVVRAAFLGVLSIVRRCQQPTQGADMFAKIRIRLFVERPGTTKDRVHRKAKDGTQQREMQQDTAQRPYREGCQAVMLVGITTGNGRVSRPALQKDH